MILQLLLFNAALAAPDAPPPAPTATLSPTAVGVAPAVPLPPPTTCPSRAVWPTPTWASRIDETAAASPDALAALDAYLFNPDLDRADPERRGVRTDGVLIVHQGRVIYERYGPEYGPETRHLAWSATKSFVNALIGVAVQEGRLSIDDSICAHLPDLPADSCRVRVVDLMEFGSGFDWAETYENSPPTTSAVLAMLYGEGRGDMATFVTQHPLRDPPGTTWAYSSGDTNVLSAVAGQALAPTHGDRFPWVTLLDRIGAQHTTWERDGVGTYVGSSYLWAPPRDMARFGYLLLNDGCWQGQRILPEDWVHESTQVSAPFRSNPLGHSGGAVQGRQFWLNRPVPEQGIHELPWPDAPEGSFAALGHWRQGIYVIAERDLVVVRTGDDRDGSFSHNELLRLALALAPESK